jgi:hypothetical protein
MGVQIGVVMIDDIMHIEAQFDITRKLVNRASSRRDVDGSPSL